MGAGALVPGDPVTGRCTHPSEVSCGRCDGRSEVAALEARVETLTSRVAELEAPTRVRALSRGTVSEYAIDRWD